MSRGTKIVAICHLRRRFNVDSYCFFVSKKYDANGSKSMSAKVSGATDTPSVGTVFGSFEPLVCWEEVASASSCVCRGSTVNTEGSNSS